MSIIRKLNENRIIKQYTLIVIGCFIAAASYPLFLEPNFIAPGGLTGITTILNYHFNLPIGLTSLILNIPLMLAGWRLIGAGFIFRTILATLLFSFLIDLLHLPALSDDPLLASIFGGIMLGVGLALIFRGNATTGGTDLMARIVHHYQRAITIGVFLFAFDTLVILLTWIFLSASHALYAMICVFVIAKVLDQVLTGFGNDKACYIISKQYAQIEKRLMTEMERGVTRFDAVGAYSGEPIKMLLCIVGQFEAPKLKTIVNDEDPTAFMFITDTHETLGEGFAKLIEEEQ
ncbi:MAG: YitT family protein [Bacillota bacterium]|nr:YitT family protein [Bacillota bacterium]